MKLINLTKETIKKKEIKSSKLFEYRLKKKKNLPRPEAVDASIEGG